MKLILILITEKTTICGVKLKQAVCSATWRCDSLDSSTSSVRSSTVTFSFFSSFSPLTDSAWTDKRTDDFLLLVLKQTWCPLTPTTGSHFTVSVQRQEIKQQISSSPFWTLNRDILLKPHNCRMSWRAGDVGDRPWEERLYYEVCHSSTLIPGL